MSSKVVVVTGAGRGLGAEIARQCAREGARVVLAGRTVQGLESVRDEILADGGQALVQPTDILDSQSVQSLFAATKDESGRSTSWSTMRASLLTSTSSTCRRPSGSGFSTPTSAACSCASREAGRHFREMRSGRVVNVASVFGLLGRPGFSAYCASKGAVVNFTRAVAAEWARFGAQMNAVAPGYFATDINAELRKDDAAMAKVLRRIPPTAWGARRNWPTSSAYLASAGAGLPHGSDHRGRRGRVERLTTLASHARESSSVSRCARPSAVTAACSRTCPSPSWRRRWSRPWSTGPGSLGTDVDDVIFGQGYANGEAAAIGRIAALDAGLDISVPGLQIDRRCGSGLQSVLYACMQVSTGGSDLVLAGGAESMSQAEYYLPDDAVEQRRGARSCVTGSREPRPTPEVRAIPVAGGMIETAENVGREYGISRMEQDEWAVRSHDAGCCRDRGRALRRRDGAGGHPPAKGRSAGRRARRTSPAGHHGGEAGPTQAA